jgi:hypothetical protein
MNLSVDRASATMNFSVGVTFAAQKLASTEVRCEPSLIGLGAEG